MGILEELYNGQVYPFEEIVPQDEAYRETNQKISEIREYFYENLSPEEREKFEEMNRLSREVAYMESYANFAYGFRLSALLMCDVFIGENDDE